MPPHALPSLRATRKRRPGVEVLNELVYRPLAQLLVPPLARAGVAPESVVLFHTALGLLAAWQVSRGERLAPALLLQVKTVLDNADGQLARATGRTSQVGRYLDSEMDLLVNAALLLAMSRRRGPGALVTLQLILTADYLLEKAYREARGETFREAPARQGDGALLAGLRGAYNVFFLPQEKLLSRLFEARFQALGGTNADKAAYAPRWATHLAANLGLSTQLAFAGICLAFGRPGAYLASLPLQALALVGAQLGREYAVKQRRAWGRQFLRGDV